MRIQEDFYKMPATEAAPALVGKLLCRRIDGRVVKRRITETECYYGQEDTACHAARGKTERNKVIYEAGGIAYIYLCYGMHNLLNVVTGPKGHPEAVLLRGIEGAPGPGRLTKAMEIDRRYNGESFLDSDELWLEDDGYKAVYTVGKRIGIDYATPEYRDILWRYTLAEEEKEKNAKGGKGDAGKKKKAAAGAGNGKKAELSPGESGK